jgi:hypothetical protein
MKRPTTTRYTDKPTGQVIERRDTHSVPALPGQLDIWGGVEVRGRTVKPKQRKLEGREGR